MVVIVPFLSLLLPLSHAFLIHHPSSTHQTLTKLNAESQLAQLAGMTTLSIDSGDLAVIQEYAATGHITDATTNPLFVSQAGFNPVYAEMVQSAVDYGQGSVELSMDRLAVLLGKAIADIVPGYISTEVDPRLSFDTEASIDRAHRIIDMYKELGLPKERILVKLAATWEGIQAAHQLEKEGIQCNLTLIFGVTQAIACAQYGAHLISPFPGRILDWHKSQGLEQPTKVEQDPGVQACTEIHNYYQTHEHDTILMPASWRPSRGAGGKYDLDEIRALAGASRMTIPSPLLAQLAESTEPLEQQLFPEPAERLPLEGNGKMTEQEFRLRCTLDGCTNDKLAEGLRAFIAETEKLQTVMEEKTKG